MFTVNLVFRGVVVATFEMRDITDPKLRDINYCIDTSTVFRISPGYIEDMRAAAAEFFLKNLVIRCTIRDGNFIDITSSCTSRYDAHTTSLVVQTGQDPTGQSTPEQFPTGHDPTGQDPTGQEETVPEESGQGESGQEETVPEETGAEVNLYVDLFGRTIYFSGFCQEIILSAKEIAKDFGFQVDIYDVTGEQCASTTNYGIFSERRTAIIPLRTPKARFVCNPTIGTCPWQTSRASAWVRLADHSSTHKQTQQTNAVVADMSADAEEELY